MTVTESREAEPVAAESPAGRRPWWHSRRGLLTGLAVAVVVAVLAQLPLIHNRIFYFWDDSAAAFLPDWHYIGTQLMAGVWPTMSPEMWMGGNIAGESMMGLFNPIMLANYLAVAGIPDLAVSATLVKTEFLVILALGVYLLARNFGAGRRAAAVVAIAMPFTGYILYFDATSWAGGLIAFAFLPWVWWSLRKFSRGELNPIVPAVIGFLAMTVGNPYGALGVAVIVLAVAVEQLAQKDWRAVGKVVLIGVLVGVGTLTVFLPLVGSSAVTWRSSLGMANDGFMVPGIGDLFAMSAPLYRPQFAAFGGTTVLSVPLSYLAWFIMPLAPWLRWSALREHLRARSSLIVFAAIYLTFLFGPSYLWLFRWPARLTGYAYLPLAIAIAIVLTKGLKTDYLKRRAAASALIVVAGSYLSWAASPQHIRWQALTTVLVLGLVAAAVYTYRKRPAWYGGTLVAGTAILLFCQVSLFPGNQSVTPWYFPHNVTELKDRFDQRYQGNTLFVADLDPLRARAPLAPDGVWRDVLFTNIVHTAGVDALNSYSGIGYRKFADALCMKYYGGTCADAYPRLFEPVRGTDGAQLADVLRLQTIVVDNNYLVSQDDPDVRLATPAGWSVAEKTDLVTVLSRDAALPFDGGRVSWMAPDVRVLADEKVGENGERFTYEGRGSVVLAMLAWPGYEATVDGRVVPVEQGPAGLVRLELPESAAGGSTVELSFTPPGFSYGIPFMAVCLLACVGYGVFWEVSRRRRDGRRQEAQSAVDAETVA